MSDAAERARLAQQQALARRAQGQPAAVRALLERRLAAASGAPAQGAAADAPLPASPQREEEHLTGPGPLRASERAPAATVPAQPDQRRAAGPDASVRHGALAQLLAHAATSAPAGGDLRSLAHFRRALAGTRAQTRVLEAASRAPAQAGPLNSQALVMQALDLMQALPGDYLRRFLAHAETLLWLEAAAAQPAPQAATTSGKARKRKPRAG